MGEKYMKRLGLIMAGLALILCAPTALANNSQSYPPPYTGGASVAKYFHLSDGSTMTITSTGAVIKQGRNGTPYRQGWINPADIGQINSFQDLRGRLAYGETNPYLQNSQNMDFQVDAHKSKDSITTSASASAVSYSTAAAYTPPSTKAETAQPAPAVRSLPNTGPSGAVALGAIATILGTAGHYIYTRRQGSYF